MGQVGKWGKIPKTCNCGVDCTVAHALSCPPGGFPTLRHKEIRDLLADVITEACNSVAIKHILNPVDVRNFRHKLSIPKAIDPNVRVDIVAGGV